MTLYLLADAMIIAACAAMHITMMVRLRARSDLKFRMSLAALAAVFAAFIGLVAWDMYEIATALPYQSPWMRLCAGAISLICAVLVAQPGTQRYYMSISSPEEVSLLRDQMEAILRRWDERDANVRSAT